MKGTCTLFFFFFFSASLSSQVCGDLIQNGDFENPANTQPQYPLYLTSPALPYWNTTAADGVMEIWSNGFSGVLAYVGNQHLEINSSAGALTVYQDFNVSAGVLLDVGFAHRGREGVDTMEVSIGPVGGPYTSLGKWGDGQSWNYYTSPTYTPPAAGMYRVRFRSAYASGSPNGGYDPTFGEGNFIDDVSVNASLNLQVSANPTPICIGKSSTLTATPATNCTWNGVAGSPTISVSPTVTTNYYVYATINNCGAGKSLLVVVRPLPVITTAQQTFLACGGSTVLSASGGASYTWSPGAAVQNPFPITPTVNTNYTVTGASAFGCINTATCSVLFKPVPNLDFNNAPITCTSLGASTVITLGGTGPFTYTWLPTAQTGSTASNLNANTYTATVFDAGTGCYTSSTNVVASLSPLTATLSKTNKLKCYAVNTGTAAFGNVSGALGPVSYSWTNGVLSYGTTSVNALSAGTWTATITDATTACKVYSVFTITQPPVYTLSLSAASPSTCAGTSVVLSSTVNGGTPAYTYTWTPGNQQNVQPVNSSSTMVSQNLAGTYVYTLNASDSSLCPLQKIISVVFVANPAMSVVSSSVCPQVTGSLVLTGANGYTVSNPSTTLNNPVSTFTDLPNNPNTTVQNTYTYGIVGAAQGCTSSATGSITVMPTPTISITQNATTLCDGKTFSFEVNPATTYSWGGPNGFTSASGTNVLNNVQQTQAGVYEVTISASTGCTVSATTTALVVYSTPTLGATGNTVCTAQTLSFSASSVPAVNYQWWGPLGFNSGQPTVSIANPSITQSGNYTVMVTSVNGCTRTATAKVLVMLTPSVSITQNTIGLCDSKTFSFAASSAAGYTWSGPNGYASNQDANVINNIQLVQAGVYHVTVTAVNGCTAAASTSLIVYPTPTVSTLGSNLCTNQTLTLLGNAPPGVTCQWSGPLNFSANQASFSVANPLVTQSGNYILTVTSVNGCTQTAVAKVVVFPSPTVSISSPKTRLCANENIALQANTISATGGVTYYWTGPVNFAANTQLIAVQSGSSNFSGSYSVTVTDQNNCKSGDALTITVYDLPTGVFNGQSLNGCVPFCAKIQFVPQADLAALSEIRWTVDNKNYSGNYFANCFDKTGTYGLGLSLRDTNNCSNVLGTSINVYPNPKAIYEFYPEHPIAGQDVVQFTDASTGDNLQTWSWYFANNKGYQSSQQNPAYLFDNPGTYPIAMVVKNGWGCADTIVKAVVVDSDFSIYVPNAFTPNGDHLNDLFGAVLPQTQEIQLDVFDRWGEKVFSTNDPAQAWDGTFRGKDCKADIYQWKLYVRSANEAPNQWQKEMIGEVVLIR